MKKSQGLVRGCVLGATALSALMFVACDGTALPTEPGSPAAETATAVAGTVPTDEARVDPRLALTLEANGSVDVLVAVDDQPLRALMATAALDRLGGDNRLEAMAAGRDSTKDRVLDRVSGQRLTAVARLRNLPVMHVRVESKEALAALGADPEVLRVAPDDVYTTMETTAPAPNLALIGQPQAAATGKLGTGVSVVVIDTGVDYTRAPFYCTMPGDACKVAYAADFAPEDNQRDTGEMHGTNVSGIVLAVAPGAKIIGLDVFAGNSAPATAILSAINWSIANKTKYNIAAINMSLGGGAFTSPCATDFLALGVDAAKQAGILVAVASGNEGKSSSLSSPACAPSAISVGAVYASNVGSLRTSICTDATTGADRVACFSNSASFLTVLAPGVNITAAGITMSGTSQATPHVAGALAVLRAAFPSESVADIIARLTSTGAPIKDARNNLSKPRISLPAALAAVAKPKPAPVAGPTGTIVINAAAKFTRTPAVMAAVATKTSVAVDVCLSTEATCTTWTKWAANVAFTLPGTDGQKTVRAWWRDAQGNVSAAPASTIITLDRTAPVGGKLSLTATATVATYTWTGFTDAGAGVASYKLVASSTAVPEGCASGGTLLLAGTGLTVKQTVLANKVYFFRLCAIDSIGNTSGGIAGQFTTPAATATIKR